MQQIEKVKRVLLVIGLSAGAVIGLLFVIIVGFSIADDIKFSDRDEKAEQQRQDDKSTAEQETLEYYKWFDNHNRTLHERLVAYDDAVRNDPDSIESRKQDIYYSYYSADDYERIDETTVATPHSHYNEAIRIIYQTLRETITKSDAYNEGMAEGLEKLHEAESRIDREKERIEGENE